MTYSTRTEFINGLRDALGRNGITDARDILLDFDQHFDDGMAAGETEAQVCEKLGDVEEIAKQYISEEGFADKSENAANTYKEVGGDQATAEVSGFDNNSYTGGYNAAPQAAQPNTAGGFEVSVGAVVGRICVDVFVFSWAIPALFSVIISFYSVVLSFGLTGIGCIAGGLLPVSGGIVFIETMFSPVSTVLFGCMLLSLFGLLIALCVAIGKGFVDIIKSIINWHSRAFVGRNVVKTSSMKRKEEKAAKMAQNMQGGIN